MQAIRSTFLRFRGGCAANDFATGSGTVDVEEIEMILPWLSTLGERREDASLVMLRDSGTAG